MRRLFFDRGELLTQPRGLRFSIGACQSFAWPLDGEAEFMQQARDVVVVVPDTEAMRNEVANHRSRPNATGVPRHLGPGFDERGQLGALCLVELRRGSGRLARQQPRKTHGLVPLQPTVYGTPSHVEFLGKVDDAPTLDVSEHRLGPAPDIEVVAFACRPNEATQLLAGRRRPTAWADRFPVLGTRHDHPPE